MAPKTKHVIRITLNNKTYHFCLRFAVLVAAVLVGVLIAHVGHWTGNFEAIALGAARTIELAGEAGADAIAE